MIRKPTCIVIDDDEIDRLTVLAYVRKYPILEVIGSFSSATEAAIVMRDNPIDVLLTDIDMPEMSGLEFRARMRQIPVCVFITAFPDYASESYEVDALDFLVKPLKAERFAVCMERIQNYLELKQKAELFEHSLGGNTVFIKSGHDQVKVNLHDIVYLEALKDYTRIITTHKQHCVLTSIGNLLQETAFQSFLRIHRSFAVQPHYIDRITSQQVHLQKYTLPIGRSYKDALLHLK
jgi:two-component system LytT family response regulator